LFVKRAVEGLADVIRKTLLDEKRHYSMVNKLSIQLQAMKAASDGKPEASLLQELISEARSSFGLHRVAPQPWDSPRYFFSNIKNQSDLGKMLIGTTWRKRNNVEHIIFSDESTFYNNHAGHPKWKKNEYALGKSLGSMTLIWSSDGFQAQCKFNEQFNEFVELANPNECLWTIIASEPHTSSWAI
jgi:hypothetical protein